MGEFGLMRVGKTWVERFRGLTEWTAGTDGTEEMGDLMEK